MKSNCKQRSGAAGDQPPAAQEETSTTTTLAPAGATAAEPDCFIDEATLRKRLPLSRRTIFDWRESGKLPFIRLPGSSRVLYDWAAVRSALLRQQRGGGR